MIAFTNGVFDLLHVGHLHILEQARLEGDTLVVGLNSDESVRRLKGNGRPMVSQKDRKRLLLALSCVDRVVVFDGDTPERLIRSIEPDVLVKGEDWAEEDIVGAEFVKARGGRVVRVPLLEGVSTSLLIARIRANGAR